MSSLSWLSNLVFVWFSDLIYVRAPLDPVDQITSIERRDSIKIGQQCSTDITGDF